MQILKRITAVIAVLGLTAAMMAAVNYCIVDDTGAFTRLMMYEFYEQDDIDLLFVGASQYANGIDPAIITECTGRKAFVATSAGQNPEVSLAIIKEALKRYTPEHIYLNLSYRAATELTQPLAQRTLDLLAAEYYIVSDYMPWSGNKLEMLLNASGSELYPATFLVPHNIMEHPFSPAAVLANLRKKVSAAYKNYTYEYAAADEEIRYTGNGHQAYTTATPPRFVSQEGFGPCTVDNVSEEWKTAVNQIISVCAEHGVPLTVVNPPVSDDLLLSMSGYDRYIGFLREFTAGKPVDVVDFDLLDTAVWPGDPECFFDVNHLNENGCKAFSELLADYINGALPAQAFLPSVEERLEKLAPRYYGLSFYADPAEQVVYIHIIASHPEQLEFRLSYLTEEGEEIVGQEFSPNTMLVKQAFPYTDIAVSWKKAGAPDETATRVVHHSWLGY